eukprot:gb/GECG01008340.1/.p1 GENE.gb/GECG01008340.1/~~gb/GECG01008340.1/.p1  ORF type:complete len:538 (+),score=64.32 gb/GECG01008340.1/:1-1614(+)
MSSASAQSNRGGGNWRRTTVYATIAAAAATGGAFLAYKYYKHHKYSGKESGSSSTTSSGPRKDGGAQGTKHLKEEQKFQLLLDNIYIPGIHGPQDIVPLSKNPVEVVDAISRNENLQEDSGKYSVRNLILMLRTAVGQSTFNRLREASRDLGIVESLCDRVVNGLSCGHGRVPLYLYSTAEEHELAGKDKNIGNNYDICSCLDPSTSLLQICDAVVRQLAATALINYASDQSSQERIYECSCCIDVGERTMFLHWLEQYLWISTDISNISRPNDIIVYCEPNCRSMEESVLNTSKLYLRDRLLHVALLKILGNFAMIPHGVRILTNENLANVLAGYVSRSASPTISKKLIPLNLTDTLSSSKGNVDLSLQAIKALVNIANDEHGVGSLTTSIPIVMETAKNSILNLDNLDASTRQEEDTHSKDLASPDLSDPALEKVCILIARITNTDAAIQKLLASSPTDALVETLALTVFGIIDHFTVYSNTREGRDSDREEISLSDASAAVQAAATALKRLADVDSDAAREIAQIQSKFYGRST